MAKPLRLRLTPAATADLETIWTYTAQTWSISQADRYVDSLTRSFDTLCDMPGIARIRPEFTPPVRLYPSAQHVIVYHVVDDTVIVIRVLGKRQSWGMILGDG